MAWKMARSCRLATVAASRRPDPREGHTEPTPSVTHDAVRTASIGRRHCLANDLRWVVPATESQWQTQDYDYHPRHGSHARRWP